MGITMMEVLGASACGGPEAEGQEYFALCLRSFVPQDKLSDPEALLEQKARFFVLVTQYSIISTMHWPAMPTGLPFEVFQTEISGKRGLGVNHGTGDCQIARA